MLSLHTNQAALSSESAISKTNTSLTTSLTRLGTGYRVNSAMDDAAGLQIATRIEAQTNGMKVAQQNAQNGISLAQSAEGSLNELTNVLLRMKDLVTQAADASTSAGDQVALQDEFDQLGQELGNIFNNSSYGGQQLFAESAANGGGTAGSAPVVGGILGSTGGLVFQIGASGSETMAFDTTTQVSTLATDLTGISANFLVPGNAVTQGTEISDAAGGTKVANSTITPLIDTINTAIDAVGSLRGELGAAANRLDHVYNNLSNEVTNATAAQGRIMDVDYASETSNSTSLQLQLQAGTSALKQASSSMSQMVQTLLQ